MVTDVIADVVTDAFLVYCGCIADVVTDVVADKLLVYCCQCDSSGMGLKWVSCGMASPAYIKPFCSRLR